MSQSASWKWVGAGALLVCAMVFRALAEDDESTGYAIGTAFGMAFVALGVAAAARFVYLRVASRGEGTPFWAPSVLATAAAIALVLATASTGANSDNSPANVASRVDDCLRTPSPLSNPGGELALAELSEQQRQGVLSAFGDSLPAGYDPEDLDIQRVASGPRVVGLALAIPGIEGQDLEDFEAGMASEAEQQGGATQRIDIGGRPAVIASVPSLGAAVAGGSGCYGVVIRANDQETATTVARALIEG